MNINTVRSALIKRAGLFDSFAKATQFNPANAGLKAGVNLAKSLTGKMKQPAATQPQATQPVQQPAGNALPQDTQGQQAAPVAQQNEALINSFNKMMSTISSSNRAFGQAPQTIQQPQPAQMQPQPKQPSYFDAVNLNNQK